MKLELIEIKTDTIPLDGLFYEPEEKPTKGAIMICHGNTMNFYTGAPRFLPPRLCQLGFACLSFNRRGHDIMSIRDSRKAVGAAFQTTGEGIADNEFASKWLERKGFKNPILIGHSNGGFLAVQHAARNPHTPALILLSAHGGGKVAEKLASRTGLLGGSKTNELREQAIQMISEGKGNELLLLPGWWYVTTANSYIDRLTTMPNTVQTAPKIKCPSLFIRGDLEIPEAYPAEAFAAASSGKCDVEIIKNCDHFYKNKEHEVTEIVSKWLAKNIIK